MKKLLVLLVFVFAVTAFDCGDKSNNNQPNASIQNSPLGVRVESDAPVDGERLNAIDTALTTLFADAAVQGYTAKMSHSDYAIFVNRSCVDRGGVMAWLGTGGSNYDQSEFDHDPRVGHVSIYRAEEVVQTNNVVQPRYIICFDSPANMGLTARYGAEHVILFYNEPYKYLETQTHTSGNGHPIIPGAN